MAYLTQPVWAGYTDLDLVIVAFAVLVMPAMSIQAGRAMAREAPDARNLIPRYWRIILRGWLAAAIVVAAWWVQGRPFGALGLAPHLSVWDYAGFALAVVIGVAMPAQLLRLAKAPDDAIKQNMEALRGLKITPNTGGEHALFMLMSVTAGVWEELVYRGFLIWFFAPLAGLAGAAPISSAIFGIGHLYQGWKGVLKTGVIGLLFAGAYLVTHSLWGLMAIHAALDIAGGITSFGLKRVAARRGLA